MIGQRLTPVASSVIDEVRAATAASDEAILGALADVGLTAIVGQRADELSGGQLRRVQVARAIVAVREGDARIVLADEPTAHLDGDSADAVWEALAALAREHDAAVLITTHDPRCRAVADRVLELAPDKAPELTDLDRVPPSHRPDVTVRLSAPAPNDDVGSRRSVDTHVATSAGLTSSLRRVLAMARPARRRFVGAAALGTAAEICTIGLAGTAAWLIVRASEQPDLAALSVAILGVRAFGTFKGVFRYAERLATHDTGLRSLTEIRAAVVSRLAEIAPAGVPDWQRGDLLQRIVSDIDRLLDMFVRVLGPVAAVAATTLGALVITATLDVSAGLILLGSITVIGVLLPAITIRGEASIGPALNEARAAFGSRVLAATEGLDRLWANRTLSAVRRDVDRSAHAIDDLERRRARLRMSGGAVVAAGPLLTSTACLAALAASGGSLSGPVIGVLVLWPLAIGELVGTVNEAAASVPGIAGAAQRVVAVLDTPDPVIASTDPHPVAARPTVVLDSVTARWPHADSDALGPVSMQLTAGDHAVVSGPSGSGKSTLAAVLVDFLSPQFGDLLPRRHPSGSISGSGTFASGSPGSSNCRGSPTRPYARTCASPIRLRATTTWSRRCTPSNSASGSTRFLRTSTVSWVAAGRR